MCVRAKASPTRLQGVVDLLKEVIVLEIDQSIAHRFGQLRAALLDLGLGTPDLDLLIAATALEHGLVLVTHNVVDYANVPGLTIQDWLTP